MIQDSARHTEIPRTGWKYSISVVLLPTQRGGREDWMLAGDTSTPRWSQFQPHRKPQCPVTMETSLALGWGPREPAGASLRGYH